MATDELLLVKKHSALSSLITRLKELLFGSSKPPVLKFRYSGMVKGASVDSKGRRVR